MAEPDVHCFVLMTIDAECVDGSRQITADCGHETWISPRAFKVVNNPLLRTLTVCLYCAGSHLVDQVETQGGLFALPGAREDLAAEIGVGTVDQIWSALGIREHDPEGNDGAAR